MTTSPWSFKIQVSF